MNWLHGMFGLITFFAPTIVAQPGGAGPSMWFGFQVGGNLNSYSASIRSMNSSTISPAQFDGGSGVGFYGGGVVEYHGSRQWGGAMAISYNGRGGAFDDGVAGGTYSLKTTLAYVSVEPSLCYWPTGKGLRLFAGPTLELPVKESFQYTVPRLASTEGDWSNVRSPWIGAQFGIGYDFLLTRVSGFNAVTPFFSVHAGQDIRTSERWNAITVRAGIQFTFASCAGCPGTLCDVDFSIDDIERPTVVTPQDETLPLLNCIFFDENAVTIPKRYNRLSKDEAAAFFERRLLDRHEAANAQMHAYANVLNVLGARMRANVSMTIELKGVLPESIWEASHQRAESIARAMAASVKEYLASTFGISENRIRIRTGQPHVESCKESPGPRFAAACREENIRVEISPPLQPVKISSVHQELPDDNIVVPLTGQDASNNWTLQVIDKAADVLVFQQEISDGRIVLSVADVLNGRKEGEYLARLSGPCGSRRELRKDVSFKISAPRKVRAARVVRHSILFEFDKSRTVGAYEGYLRNDVARAIEPGSRIFVHGHTDVIGEGAYNSELSLDRARETAQILRDALQSLKVTFSSMETKGFGNDATKAQFGNRLPEERFYNRAVVIDIEMP